jgi:hypothetical protein
MDNDCDGVADEGFGLGAACDGTDVDLCAEGVLVCNATGDSAICSDRSATNVELCDGLDNDCDGGVDEDFATPGPVSQLMFGTDSQQMTWGSVPLADSYDLVKGGLMMLLSSAGDFSSSLLGCLENDGLDTGASDAAIPAAGRGFFYLVRAKAACKSGTYNSGESSQQGDRDTEVAACPWACP